MLKKLLLGGALGAAGAILARRRQDAVRLAVAQRERARGVADAGRKQVGRLRQGQPSSLEDLTKEELYQRAQEADIPGRSEMSKDELIAALRSAS